MQESRTPGPQRLYPILVVVLTVAVTTLLWAYLFAPRVASGTVAVSSHGSCDERRINSAIKSLPPAGGIVSLDSGTFEICAGSDGLGGILIERSNVTLQGQGASTLLKLADGQNTNVVRIHGTVENITVRGLRIDGNSANNPGCTKIYDYPVPQDGFECSGIKAHYLSPAEYASGAIEDPTKHVKRVWVHNVIVENAGSINIMLAGNYMYVFDSFLGDARSDSVEILVGPGQISRTTLVVDAKTGYGLSTDAANNVQLNDNLLHVTNTGEISQSLVRTWEGLRGNQVNDNLMYMEPNSQINRILELNTMESQAAGNLVRGLYAKGWQANESADEFGNSLFLPEIKPPDTK